MALLGKSSIFDKNAITTLAFNHQKLRKKDWINPTTLLPSKKCNNVTKSRRSSSTATSTTGVVAVISEDLMRAVAVNKAVNFKVKAVVTVKNKNKEELKEKFFNSLDSLNELFGKHVFLELVSTEIDPITKKPMKSTKAILKDWYKKSHVKNEQVYYTAEFLVNSNFGFPGAILVSNKHHNEFYIETISVEGFSCGPVHFPCNSWIQSQENYPEKRIFFSNKPYLPHETPNGIKELREEELKNLRGDGTGERKLSDRIYDYDIYNDLGNPDKGIDSVRPNLGGGEIAYPRRCRTGRPPMQTDSSAESRIEKPNPMYVPRDEEFDEIKMDTFKFGRFKGALHNLIPTLMTKISSENKDFKGFIDVDNLYIGSVLQKLGLKDDILKKLPFAQKVSEAQGLFKYDLPHILSKDKYAWLRDDEFARQAIAGVNPVSIERLTVFPPVSTLDPNIYGSLDSALKEEHILPFLNGMTVQQALDDKKLYIVDYHDAFLPFIDRINALDGHKSYATRTLFLLSSEGTLKPIAIELSLPPTYPSTRTKRVVTPPVDATSNWIWLMAKAHVCTNDAGAHQLLHHWLKTHASVEPFIIAAHRQLSVMHPIYKLLKPHMRYTMHINCLARQSLISIGGVIEDCFTAGRYGMQISADSYKNTWRFDMQGLPADLIQRGMAEPDPNEPHGLKLLIEDYPFARDGLLVWSTIEHWVRTYVNQYYPNSQVVLKDKELQAFYSESVNAGHADLKDAPWWPKLDTPENLVSILTNLIWLASALHAALNFGQYPYGGYLPNRPPLMRRLIPDEKDPEYANFLSNPQKYFLSALPSLLTSTRYMAVVDALSTHSPDEEYIGERRNPSTWTGDVAMIEAFFEFSAEIKKVEKEIEKRNLDPSNKNRCGAGVLPYELFVPSSLPGVTCRGIPNSSSI